MWFPRNIPKRTFNTMKVITIKNFKGAPTIPEGYVDKEWGRLHAALIKIQLDVDPDENCEDLYRIVDNLCKLDFKLFLLQNLSTLTDDHLAIKQEELLQYKDVDLLYKLAEVWQKFFEKTKLIRNIFLPVDGASSTWKYTSVLCLHLKAFRNKIIMNPVVQANLIRGMLCEIQKERSGSLIDHTLMKTLVDMLNALQLFDDVFKSAFLNSAREFYSEESKTLMQNFNIHSYLQHVASRMKEESNRMSAYLNTMNSNEVLSVVLSSFIKAHIAVILDGMSELLEFDKSYELALLYKLLSLANCTKSMEEYFSSYIINYGSVIISKLDNDKNMIQELLDFKTKVDAIVTGPFQNNQGLQEIVRYAFSQFINRRQNKPAELLAKYVDTILRSKLTSECETEDILMKVMVIFRLVQGKDVFEAFYKKDLAKRLLLGKFTSWDVEKSMLSKLKEECGSNYTAKLEGMFKDITLSNGINAAFKQHILNVDSEYLNNVDVSITVLTSSNWPNYPSITLNVPGELIRFQLAFQEFYTSNHRGRKLLWKPSLGHCLLKSRFGENNKELQVSLFQCVVLLLFNETDKLSYAEIKELTNLDCHELKRTLLSLACGKHRVLLKNPKGVEIKEDDEFCFNNAFNEKLFRIKINQIQLKETPEEQRATEESVLLDRQFQIDAAIVRIMKKEKILQHNILMSQLYKVLDIPINPLSLKKRIEQLIEREYIERDQANPSAYKYVA